MQGGSAAAGVEYISAWHTLCNPQGCLRRTGPTASDVVTSDIVRLSDARSVFLVEAIKGSLSPRSQMSSDRESNSNRTGLPAFPESTDPGTRHCPAASHALDIGE